MVVAAIGLALSAPVLAGPTGPLSDAAIRSPWSIPARDAAPARAPGALAWPLREASTGDRNLDLLLAMPAVPGESIRPVDAHPVDSAAAALPPGLDLLRYRFAPGATLPVAPGAVADGGAGIDSAAALLPAMSQRQLQEHSQAVVDPSFDNPLRGADWRNTAAAEPELPHSDGAPAGSEAPVRGHSQRSAADWLAWPADGMRFIRAHWVGVLTGAAAMLALTALLKAYSRRI